MSRLLRADFVRMFKSRIFWAGVLFMAGFAGFAVFTRWSDMKAVLGYYCFADDILFVGEMYVGMVISVFMGIFVAVEYSSGTIRNKHIIGHSRTAMYLSNLVICSVASVIMNLAFIAVVLASSAIGIIGELSISHSKAFFLILVSTFSVIALTAIFLFVYMLITGRIAGFAATIMCLFMLFTASSINYRLSAKEYIEPYSITVVDENGEEQEVEQPLTKNPKYLTGTKKKVFLFLHDTLPMDQILQIVRTKTCDVDFIVSSLVITIVVTGVGIFIFRKKDLK